MGIDRKWGRELAKLAKKKPALASLRDFLGATEPLIDALAVAMQRTGAQDGPITEPFETTLERALNAPVRGDEPADLQSAIVEICAQASAHSRIRRLRHRTRLRVSGERLDLQVDLGLALLTLGEFQALPPPLRARVLADLATYRGSIRDYPDYREYPLSERRIEVSYRIHPVPKKC
jgi:hypothetical protein